MERLLDQALEQGAVGLSSGLIYPPGVYAPPDELVRLARVAGRYGRPYATHMRDEADHVTEAIDEALHVAQAAGVPLQISHHKVAGRRNWGRSDATLAQIERARRTGVDVTIDAYPYLAGSTMLRALLPPWANEGGVDALLERLGDPRIRAQIARDYKQACRTGRTSYVRRGGIRSLLRPRHAIGASKAAASPISPARAV